VPAISFKSGWQTILPIFEKTQSPFVPLLAARDPAKTNLIGHAATS
jgi:hypothetical protein